MEREILMAREREISKNQRFGRGKKPNLKLNLRI